MTPLFLALIAPPSVTIILGVAAVAIGYACHRGGQCL